MANILIVDQQYEFVQSFNSEIGRLGHRSTRADTLSDGLNQIKNAPFDLVVLQASLPDGSCFEVLSEMIKAPSHPEVIVIGDNGDPLDGERAITNGAWDYIKRTAGLEPLKKAVLQALEYKTNNGFKPEQQAAPKLKFEGVLGKNPRIKICTEILVHAAESDAPVLITGETGTGKEVFAKAIHDNSSRAQRNFVILDCAALPETLVQSTLFGHTKGAYTGAANSREGLIKQADGGTLFLDEIGELPLQVQTSFLRVLETKRFRPVGSGREVESDFRIVAATNQDLDTAVEQKSFRKDLLYRLRTFSLELPPLREHPEDIAAISQFHLEELCEAYEIPPKRVSSELLGSLAAYSWPGNIRELVNSMERALVAAREETVLYSKHLPINIRVELARAKAGKEGTEPPDPVHNGVNKQIFLPTLQEVREASKNRAEMNYLEELMTATEGDIQLACQVANISRSRIYGLLRKHGVSRF
jgi:two-component system, NtrC family, response regulator